MAVLLLIRGNFPQWCYSRDSRLRRVLGDLMSTTFALSPEDRSISAGAPARGAVRGSTTSVLVVYIKEV
ncbi:uncharacterized protein SOCEGT47_025970 [Sorangium cellulosum]|uniref:Uncharacterized protein n=1 Tax=Sorangium cellulosum TaxID=56 RepID=A0A4P2PZQ5_SORCE|nr:uncharacterized protein SOCEGT47_025970 [Sorangium cellulosum]